MHIEKPSNLVRIFPLYEKPFVIHDAEGDIWFFKENLQNTIYPRYTLSGKTLGKGRFYFSNLYCMFLCSESEIVVFIEDVFTTKRKRHIGSWVVNRLIYLLRTLPSVVKVIKIYGYCLPDREEEEASFFRRFGFEVKPSQTGRKIVTVMLEDLHVAVIDDVREIGIEDVVKEWFAKL